MSPQQNFLAKQKKKKNRHITQGKLSLQHALLHVRATCPLLYALIILRVTSSTDKTVDLG